MSEATQRLIDAANELTEQRRRWVYLEYRDPKQHRRVRRRHDIGKLSLIGILELDVARDDDTSPKAGGGQRARGFASKPPGHYAPRELLAAFTHELAIWLAWLGIDQRNGPTHHIRGIVGLATTLEQEHPATLVDITRSLETWADELRRYAGLDHLFRPRTTCPQCDTLGRLTIWIDEDSRRADRARCGACRATWDRATVGVLVEHIRTGGKPMAAQPQPAADTCPRCGDEAAAIGGERWACVPCQLELALGETGTLVPAATQGAA